jgi:hypothetical protein
MSLSLPLSQKFAKRMYPISAMSYVSPNIRHVFVMSSTGFGKTLFGPPVIIRYQYVCPLLDSDGLPFASLLPERLASDLS